MRLQLALASDWPPLAWLARCDPATGRIDVVHGPRVERGGEDWFCEAAWAGPYRDGGFDLTDVVAGSGARIRDGVVDFVSSGSTVDRLQSLESPTETVVSNSLPALLAAVGASLSPCYRWYKEDLLSIVLGLRAYRRWLATTAGPVQLTYFDNLRWDGQELSVTPKPCAERRFSDFAGYHDFLRSSMALLGENIGAAERRHRYEFLGTLSSGYDSTTVATLARDVGCREVLSFDRAHGGATDTGERAADRLGLRMLVVAGDGWRSTTRPEIPFIAANGVGEEVRYRAAEPYLSGRVLLTGYHGDKIWDTHTKDLGDHIRRGDSSGSGLMEYRLSAGFLHCPVPFWGVRQIRDVHAISISAAMAPWDVGGDYSRPICRRVVEGAGVPRDAFGQRKLAASIMLQDYDEFLTPASMEDYLDWLGAHRWEWLRRWRVPPIRSVELDRRIFRSASALAEWLRRRPGTWRLAEPLERPLNLRYALFPWAVERAAAAYRLPA